MSQTISTFALFLVHMFRENYGGREIRIMDIDLSKGNTDSGAIAPMVVYKEEIELFDFELSLDLLRNFGGEFKNLTIGNHNIDNEHSAIINQFISKYCFDSLIKLDLGEIKEKTFQQFTMPFKNLEDLAFTIYKTDKISNETLPLNKLFPNLRRIKLQFSSEVNLIFFQYEFAQLEYIEIRSGAYMWGSIEKFLRKNQQIKSIYILFTEDIHSNYLNDINELLPNLETLEIHNDIKNVVHFENVKTLNLGLGLNSIEKLSFSQLQALEMWYLLESFDTLKTFFRKNRDLRYLNMNSKWNDLKELEFFELTAELPELVDMTLSAVPTDWINIETIAKFIDVHSKLKKFRFCFSISNNEFKVKLYQRFGNEWNIQEHNLGDISDGFSLLKKV